MSESQKQTIIKLDTIDSSVADIIRELCLLVPIDSESRQAKFDAIEAITLFHRKEQKELKDAFE